MKKLLALLFILLLSYQDSLSQEEVNIYTSRHYDSDIKIYEEFENRTGIKVNYITGKGNALFESIKSDGKNCPADIFITVDAGNLWKVEKEGYFQKIKLDKISNVLDKRFIGPNGKWIGIAKRFRVIVYNPDKFDKNKMQNISYEDLVSNDFKNKIAIRSSSNIYNQSLIASLIYHNGESKTKKWLKGFVSNFSRKPQGNDRAQGMSVAYGEADLAIVNHYYLGIMLSGKSGEKQKSAAEKVLVAFPNTNNRGVHVNISGAGILKNSKNYNNAVKYLEFLLEKDIQKHIVSNTYEYPIIDTVEPSPVIKRLGSKYKEDRLKVKELGINNPKAVRLMDRAGWK